jgi:hypothetical protein
MATRSGENAADEAAYAAGTCDTDRPLCNHFITRSSGDW